MTTKNPFPGMNPFFEQQWRDAHAALLIYPRDALQERLPPDLATAVAAPAAPAIATAPPWTAATEPIRAFVEEEIERWLEIRDTNGRLITVLELLSPSNKIESAERDRYFRKRHSFISGWANLVEIDLVRQGAPVFPPAVRDVLQNAGACYGVCVFRVAEKGSAIVWFDFAHAVASFRWPIAAGLDR